jgi:putative hydrolase of the HAD superfamily
MYSKIKAVIFDLDNTLLDFVEAKIKACKAVVERIGCGNPNELLQYFLRWRHGFESHENIADYLKDRGVYSDELYKECCRIYDEVKLESIEVYPGITEVLEELRRAGIKLAVVTDAENGHAIARLQKTGLLKYFDVIVSADMVGKRKPDPASISLALEKLGVDAADAAIVGDSLRRDIEAGKKLGMLTIYAAYGDRNFFEKEDLKADYIARNVKALLEILGSHFLNKKES